VCKKFNNFRNNPTFYNALKLLNAGALPLIRPLLENKRNSICKQACLIICNLTTGNTDLIDAVVNAKIPHSLMKFLKEDEFLSEAFLAISNIAKGNAKIRHYLVRQRVLPASVTILKSDNSKLILAALGIIDDILQIDESVNENQYAKIVKACGGVKEMKILKRHQDEAICHKSIHILKTFYKISL